MNEAQSERDERFAGKFANLRYCKTHREYWWGPCPLKPYDPECEFMEFVLWEEAEEPTVFRLDEEEK